MPIFIEKYILSKESYFAFTTAQNKASIEKNKKRIKVTSYIQIIVGLLFLASTFITKQRVNMIFYILAAITVGTGLFGKKRLSDYEKKIQESLEKGYEVRRFGQCEFKVSFFEDKLIYTIDGKNVTLLYTDFYNAYEGEEFFVIHFITGDAIIFNKDCDRKRILSTIQDGKSKMEQLKKEKEAQQEQTDSFDVVCEDNQADEQIENCVNDNDEALNETSQA